MKSSTRTNIYLNFLMTSGDGINISGLCPLEDFVENADATKIARLCRLSCIFGGRFRCSAPIIFVEMIAPNNKGRCSAPKYSTGNDNIPVLRTLHNFLGNMVSTNISRLCRLGCFEGRAVSTKIVQLCRLEDNTKNNERLIKAGCSALKNFVEKMPPCRRIWCRAPKIFVVWMHPREILGAEHRNMIIYYKITFYQYKFLLTNKNHTL